MNSDIFKKLIDLGYVNPKSEKCVWLPDMIWFNPDKINYYNTNRYDYLHIENLFIFAKAASGDFFAWDKNNEFVIFCDHGSGYGIFFAPNLEGAIFRRIVEFANGDYVDFCYDREKYNMLEDEAEEYISESEAILMLKEYKKYFGDFFKREWLDILDEFIENGFIDENGFISESQKIELIRKCMNFDKLNNDIDLN